MITLAELARVLVREPPRERTIRKMVAFLGRYGRQPASEVMRMPIRFAVGLAEDIAELMKGESPEEGID